MHQNQPQRQIPKSLLALVITSLVLIGIFSRFALVEWPNFKPIGAIAIFCGFLMSRRWMAVAVTGVMLLASDLLIGVYDWPIMTVVYGATIVACLMGNGLRSVLQPKSKTLTRIVAIGGTSLAGSCLFFLATNSAVWIAGWYPSTITGLGQAYLAGIPFFKFTLAGNLCFSLLLFSTYFAVQDLNTIRSRKRHQMPRAIS